MPWESRRNRRNGRAGLRPDRLSLERLEGRELMAYTPLGYSLPDLTISGYASTAASWQGPLTVTVDVQNLGASTLIDPTALQPGAPSHADSAPTTVAVLASRSHHATPFNSVVIGSLSIPSIKQNSLFQGTATFTLPSRPAGLPGNGGTIYVSFAVNPGGNSVESDRTNNLSGSVPVRIEAPAPELVVTGLDVPPVMQPGDTIEPVIRIANLGPADTSPQGPVTVALVASTTPRFTSGSSFVSIYTVPNIPGTSTVATGAPNQVGDVNLNPQQNIVTITSVPVTLPTSPRVYYLGVVVDPFNKLHQIHAIGRVHPGNRFSLAHRVGPPIRGLPPAGVIYPGGGANNLPFPYPPNVTPTGTTTTTPQTGIKIT